MTALTKCLSLIVAVAILSVSAARASPTDLWWNANESGWGVNVVGQSNVLFLTFFVYGSNGQPLWLVAPSTTVVSTGADGSVTYSGPLYTTTGPFLGGAFNPAAVNATQVGTVTFVHQTQISATLTYTYNGVSVSKSLTRQTWKTNANVPGNYMGTLTISRTGCSGAAIYTTYMTFSVAISSSGTLTMTMRPNGGGTCSASGPYFQDGSQGRFEGSVVSCASGASGLGGAKVIEANDSISGRWYAAYTGGCSEVGSFAGVFLN